MTTQQEAWNLVKQAEKTGRLVRPNHCECGEKVRVQAHHDDYQRPLDVRWLCRYCHVQAHRQLGTGPGNRRNPRPWQNEILQALAEYPDIVATAQYLDISTRTLYRRMAEYGIRARVTLNGARAGGGIGMSERTRILLFAVASPFLFAGGLLLGTAIKGLLP